MVRQDTTNEMDTVRLGISEANSESLHAYRFAVLCHYPSHLAATTPVKLK